MLLVGDGASDFCAATRADLTFAKSRLLDHCAVLGIPHRPIRDFFGDALVAWRELVDDGLETAVLPSEGAA